MKIYVIAGEDSGDLHTGNLIREMKKRNSQLEFRGVGGGKMEATGTHLVAHIRDINFMGFWEVIKNLGTIRKLFKTVKTDIQQWQPDAVILVDYPGFNLRMARFIHELGIRVFYYISPQVWAWKKGRVKKINAYVDRMFVILPFEKDFYAKEGIKVDFVGHPLLDVIASPQEKPTVQRPLIALLPGSRKQEIQRMLPVMLEMVPRFPDYEFVVAGAPSQDASFYHPMLKDLPVRLEMNQTYPILQQAQYALVTSGTATLETALFQVPEVVCYKGGALSYQIGKRLVRVDFISLVNLILGREVVKELIQHEFTPQQLEAALRHLMQPTTQKILKQDYQELHEKLGSTGASKRTARLILEQMG